MFKKRMAYILVVCFCAANLIPTAASFAGSKKVALSKKTVTLSVKGTYTIRLKGAKSKKVKWSSSNKKIAIVKKGVIKAKKKGTCTIWARYLGKKYGCSVRVRDQKRSTTTPAPSPTVAPTPTLTPALTGTPTLTPSLTDTPTSTPTLTVTPTPTSTPALTGTPTSMPSLTDTPTPTSPIVSEPITTDKLQLVINGVSQDTKVVSYSLTNNSDETVNIPAFVSIEKYGGQNWRSVPRTDSNVTAEAMVLSPHSKVDLETNLSTSFTDLSSGKYRLCIQTPYGKIGAEFTIG